MSEVKSWTFYSRDENRKVLSAKIKNCKVPSRTKIYKDLRNKFQNDLSIDSIGYCQTSEFKNY